MQQYIVGMDIGSQNICVTLAKKDEDNIEFLSENIFISEGVIKGKIVDVNKLSVAIKNAIDKMKISYSDNIKWYVGIGNSNIRVEQHTGKTFIKNSYDIITEKEIVEVIKDSTTNILKDNEELVYYNIDEYIVDGNTKYEMPLGLSSETLELKFTCFIAKKDYINNIRNSLMLCGINSISIYLNCFELKNVVLNENTRDKNIMILDVGAQTTNYSIFKNNIVDFLGVIPIGGEAITKDLAICAELNNNKAEEIKLLYSPVYEKNYKSYKIGTIKKENFEIDVKLYYEVVRARLEELANLINEDIRTNGYCKSLQKIYVFGDGIVNYEGIQILLEDILKKKVIIVHKEQLNLHSASIINSICIVKSACDRLKLEYKEDANIKSLNNKEDIKTKNNKSGIINNLKKILDDIF